MTRRAFLRSAATAFLSVSLLLILWAAAAALLGSELLLPDPGETFLRFFGLFADAKFWRLVGMSVLRALEAFGLAAAVAAALAVPARLYRGAAGFFRPLVTVLRATPTISIILLALVFLPSSAAAVLVAFLILMPMLYETFFAALSAVDPGLIELCNAYRVPVRVRIFRCYLPATLPAAFSGMRSAVGLGLKVTVAAEALASTGMSLGRLLQIAHVGFDAAGMFAYTFAAILVSFLLECLVLGIRKCVVRWPG